MKGDDGQAPERQIHGGQNHENREDPAADALLDLPEHPLASAVFRSDRYQAALLTGIRGMT
jgi:hypothetical protein